jgi:hypothetical protein
VLKILTESCGNLLSDKGKNPYPHKLWITLWTGFRTCMRFPGEKAASFALAIF